MAASPACHGTVRCWRYADASLATLDDIRDLLPNLLFLSG